MEISYKFKFENDRVEDFNLVLDDDSFALQPNAIHTGSEPWMELEFHQCPGCTLSKQNYPLCPVAANMAGIVAPFRHDFSYTPVTTQVNFRDRYVVKECELQSGLSSMVGLVMATSGCPVLDKLRPMAYLHQPFSSIEETVYRALSGYLLAQYMCKEKGQTSRFEVEGLSEIYSEINKLNKAFAERLRGFEKDANINALVVLDMFALMGSFNLNENWREQLQPLFASYFQ